MVRKPPEEETAQERPEADPLQERRREQLARRAANRHRARRVNRLAAEPPVHWWQIGSVLLAISAGFSLIGGVAGGAGALVGALAGAALVAFVLFAVVDHRSHRRSSS
jgi:hypothetical protein